MLDCLQELHSRKEADTHLQIAPSILRCQLSTAPRALRCGLTSDLQLKAEEYLGAPETAWWVKHLLWKHEDLNSNPQHHAKSWESGGGNLYVQLLLQGRKQAILVACHPSIHPSLMCKLQSPREDLSQNLG